MVVDIGNPQNCYECLIRNRGYSGDGMKYGKTGSVISWYDGNRQRMADCPLEAYWIIGPGVNVTCSHCKFEAPAILFNGKWSHEFCPNCGIHMKGKITND